VMCVRLCADVFPASADAAVQDTDIPPRQSATLGVNCVMCVRLCAGVFPASADAAVQETDIPPPQSATLGLKCVMCVRLCAGVFPASADAAVESSRAGHRHTTAPISHSGPEVCHVC